MITVRTAILNQYWYNQENINYQERAQNHYYWISNSQNSQESQQQYISYQQTYKNVFIHHETIKKSQESHKSVDKFNYQEDLDQNQDSEFQKIDYSDYNDYDQFKHSEINKNSFADHIDIAEIICWKCKQDFASKNQLHNHFKVNACQCSKTDEKQKYKLQNQSIKIITVKINNNHFVLLNSCKFLKDFKICQ